MAAHLSTTGASSGPNAWHELEDVFAALGQLARSPVAPPEFYRTLLDECVRALAANGGVVWLRGPDSFQPIARLRWPAGQGAPVTRSGSMRTSCCCGRRPFAAK